MEFIRVVHPGYHYDFERNRFKDLAFRPQRSSDGTSGVSCFEFPCAVSSSGSACKHICKFYSDISSDPAVFWKFDATKIPPNGRLEPKTEREDICHYNILGASGESLRKVPKQWKIADLYICDGGTERTLNEQDLEPFRPSPAANTHTSPRSA
jgi:hypothetical protein